MHPIFYKRILIMSLLKKGLAFLHRSIKLKIKELWTSAYY